jgi:hypothetical protein
MLGSVIYMVYENVCDITKLSTMLSHVSCSIFNKLNNVSQTDLINQLYQATACIYLTSALYMPEQHLNQPVSKLHNLCSWYSG